MHRFLTSDVPLRPNFINLKLFTEYIKYNIFTGYIFARSLQFGNPRSDNFLRQFDRNQVFPIESMFDMYGEIELYESFEFFESDIERFE